MHSEFYADGVGEITVTGPIVRIDLVSLSPTERDENNKPKSVFRHRVVMPVDAFANTVDLMQKVLQGLVDAGAIRRQTDSRILDAMPRSIDPAALPVGEPDTRRHNISPNFS